MALGLLAAAPLAIGLVLAFAGPGSTDFLVEGASFTSASAKTRPAIWDESGRRLSWAGEGPGSAGEAYRHAAPQPHRPPLLFDGWNALERASGQPPFRLLLTTRLWGVFLVTAAVAVEVWEMFPVDLVAGLVFAQAFAHRSASSDP